MQRQITKELKHPKTGELFAKVGDVLDYPMATWTGIIRSLFPASKNARKKLDTFSTPIEVN